MQKLTEYESFCILYSYCCAMSGPVFISFWWLERNFKWLIYCEFLHLCIFLYPEKTVFTSTDVCGEHALSVVIIANINNFLVM